MPNPAPRRLGLLGGTFDPPHAGHLAVALTVREQLSLDRVDFLVANDPWQKTATRDVTPAAIRVEMVHALVNGHDGLGVDEREVRRGGPTYTVDTLEDIRHESPGSDVFLIVGADTAGRIHTWHRHEAVLSLSTLVIVNRIDQELSPSTSSSIHVTMSPVDVSSTEIRRRVGVGESVAGLTTDPVISVIEKHGLYRGQP